MWPYRNRLYMLVAGIVVLAATVLISGSPAYSESEVRYDLHHDQIAYGAIEYSGVFSGVADTGEPRSVIINDETYELTADCILRNRNGTLVGLSSFTKGMNVGYFVLEEQETKMISKIWETEASDGSDSSGETNSDITTNPEASQDGEIRMENGVWKN